MALAPNKHACKQTLQHLKRLGRLVPWPKPRAKYGWKTKGQTISPTGALALHWKDYGWWIHCVECMSTPISLLENKDFREFIELLSSKKARFLIVGGHAVGFHGYPRFTKDLDVWIGVSADNAKRVADAVCEFGFGKMFKPGDFENPGYAIQLGREPFRIDILTSINGVEFEAAYKRRKILRHGSISLSLIGRADLLTNKRAVARPQDLADVSRLEKRSRSKTGAGHQIP